MNSDMLRMNLARKLIVSNYMVIAVILNHNVASGQLIDSTSIKINPRFSFYSFEKGGELIVHIPPSHIRTTITLY
jgi:hypothetical protein